MPVLILGPQCRLATFPMNKARIRCAVTGGDGRHWGGRRVWRNVVKACPSRCGQCAAAAASSFHVKRHGCRHARPSSPRRGRHCGELWLVLVREPALPALVVHLGVESICRGSARGTRSPRLAQRLRLLSCDGSGQRPGPRGGRRDVKLLRQERSNNSGEARPSAPQCSRRSSGPGWSRRGSGCLVQEQIAH